MSDRTHKRELARARAKRENDRLAARQRRARWIVVALAAALVLAMVGAGVFGGGDVGSPVVDDPDDAAAADDGLEELPIEGDPDACPEPDDAPEPSAGFYDEPPRTELDPELTYTATLDTTCGTIVIELATDAAPRTAENFVALAEDGYYAGTPFHRFSPDFVIQGGDPAGTGCGQPDCRLFDPNAPAFPGYQIEDELESLADLEPQASGAVLYPRGTVAMANAGPDTAGSQFFIVQADPGYPFPPAYTVFGRVTDGMDVVDAIVAGPLQGDRAIDPVVVREVTISTS